MKDVVISLRRGVTLGDRTLTDVVLSVAKVEITAILPTGRRLVAHLTDGDLVRLRRELGEACRIYERGVGQVH